MNRGIWLARLYKQALSILTLSVFTSLGKLGEPAQTVLAVAMAHSQFSISCLTVKLARIRPSRKLLVRRKYIGPAALQRIVWPSCKLEMYIAKWSSSSVELCYHIANLSHHCTAQFDQAGDAEMHRCDHVANWGLLSTGHPLPDCHLALLPIGRLSL